VKKENLVLNGYETLGKLRMVLKGTQIKYKTFINKTFYLIFKRH